MNQPSDEEIEKAHREAADEYAKTFLERASKVGRVLANWPLLVLRSRGSSKPTLQQDSQCRDLS
jgi:hypothetical protein